MQHRIFFKRKKIFFTSGDVVPGNIVGASWTACRQSWEAKEYHVVSENGIPAKAVSSKEEQKYKKKEKQKKIRREETLF